MDSKVIQDQLAAVLKEFRARDYDSLLRSLTETKQELISRCETPRDRDLVSLGFFVTAVTLADLKGLSLDATESMVNAAFAHIASDPGLLVTSVAGYAGRCRAEGRPDLGRAHLRRAIEYMDSGKHWSRLASDAEPEIRRQLDAMEK